MPEEETPKGPWWKNPVVMVPIIVAIVGGISTIVVAVINAGDGGTGTPTPSSGCSISGQVLNSDTGQGFVGLSIGYTPADAGYSDEEEFNYLNTSGAGGSYTLDCSSVPSGSVIAATDGWGGCIWVSKYSIPRSGDHTGVNLSISDKVETLLGQLYGLPKYSSCVPPGG